LNSWSAPDNLYFILPTVFLVASLLLLSFYIKNKIHKNLFIILALILILIDLNYNFKVTSKGVEELVISHGAASFIKKQPGVFRVIPLLHLQGSDETNPLPIRTDTFLRPESNMIYDIATPEGYRSLYLDRYADIMALLGGQSAEKLKVKLCEFNNLDENILDFLNVKYVVASTITEKKFSNGYKLVYGDKQHRVFLNEDALLRVFMVHNIVTIKNKEEVLKIIASSHDFSRTVILEEDVVDFIVPAKNGKKINSYASIEKYEPNKVIINTVAGEQGFLVLLDCYYPGWQAFVDGNPAKIFKANYIFRAVRIPAGKHIVKFIYNPVSFKIGLGISVSVLLCGIILCVILRKR
ncbi:MAG: YfhO family protein, partial [Candidatus Omnitrophota bacterium]